MKRDNFLPKFNISNNLSADMRNIEISKAMSAGWYKGKIHYHLKNANCLAVLDGRYYYTNIGINNDSRDFLIKGTRGYHIAEFLRLLGFDDSDLNQLLQTWRNDSVSGLSVRWRSKNEMSQELFARYLEKLKDDISGIDTIEIEYEFHKYKASIYTTEASRVYNSKESTYGNRLQWGQKQDNYNVDSWGIEKRIFTLDQNVITKSVEALYGNSIKLISDGTDVTSNYSEGLLNTLRSMIAYSGNEFMQITSSSKIGERTYTETKYNLHGGALVTETYISAIGKETFNATIKSSFILDENNEHYVRYTGICPKKSSRYASIEDKCQEDRNELQGRSPLMGGEDLKNKNYQYYTNAFWQYSTHIESIKDISPMVNRGDEFLFRRINDNTAYIDVEAFKKLNMRDVGFYLGNYFDIYVKQKSSGGGFFGGFIGAIAGLLGTIFDIGFDIVISVPALKQSMQLMTFVINKIFDTDLSEKEVWQIGSQVALVIASVLLAPETGGTSFGLTTGEFAMASMASSIALSLAVVSSKGNDAKAKAEKEQKAKEKEQKNREAEKKLQSDEEEKKKKIDSEAKQNAEEDFQAFLKNPMYKFDRERTKMKGDLKSQFKLI